jgi:hypothetical protein
MRSIKIRNIFYSLTLLAAWTSVIAILSAKADSTPGDISALYFWAKLTSVLCGFGGLLILILRIFKVINRNTNFLYSFLGTTNIALGLSGVGFYFFRKINVIGVHDLLPNLLIGVIIFADIFFFDTIFKRKSPEQ